MRTGYLRVQTNRQAVHLNLFFMFYSSLAFPVVEQELSPCFCLLNYVQSSEVPATVKIVVDDATK